VTRIVSLADFQQFAAINLTLDPGRVAGPKIIPNAMMIRLNWTLTDGKTGHNVLYSTYTGSPAISVAQADAFFSACKGGNFSAFAAFLAPTAALASVTLLDVRSTTATEFSSTGPPAPGTSAGSAMPDEVAVVVTLKTALRGPGGRGRFYVPGWASNAEGAGGVIAATAVTALQNWVTSTLGGAFPTIGGAWVLGLPHRVGYTSPVTGRVFPDRPATTIPLTATSVKDNHWDTMRKRGLK
jgi:hypothetical protein